jgi:hypothetical protein
MMVGCRCRLIRGRRFRWVYCQLDFLRRCLPARVEGALAELPKTLDDTYERTLLEINEANWEFAHRLLQCVAVACRPLRVEELAEFLAFDFSAGPIPEFHESFRPADPIHAVLSTCPSLFSVVDVDDSEVIQFSHFSVKEYLMSARLAEGSDIMSQRYHVSMAGAHTLAAQACLGILLHLDENIDSDSLEKIPLAEYAAEHWVDHVQFKDVSQRVEAGLKHCLTRGSHISRSGSGYTIQHFSLPRALQKAFTTRWDIVALCRFLWPTQDCRVPCH